MQEEGMDALDAYMSAIKSGVMDTKTKMKLKRQLLELKKEEQKLQRMVNVAKPAALPDLKRFKISYTHFICQHYGSYAGICNTWKSEKLRMNHKLPVQCMNLRFEWSGIIMKYLFFLVPQRKLRQAKLHLHLVDLKNQLEIQSLR